MANVARGAGTSAYSFVQVPETFVRLITGIMQVGTTMVESSAFIANL